MPLTPEQIAEARKALVAATEHAGPSRGLKGATAGGIVRNSVLEIPDLRVKDHGYSTLRDFIAREIPELIEIGLSGADPIYGLVSWPPLPTLSERPINPDLPDPWRVWVSPSSQRLLGVNRDTGAVRALPSSERPREGEVLLRPLAPAAHRKIAADYLENVDVDPSLKLALTRALENPSADWWREWNSALHGTLELSRWFRQRADALEEALKHALGEAGLTNEVSRTAFKLIAEKRSHAGTTMSRDGQKRPAESSSVSSPQSREELLGLLLAIVPQMSEEELRSLRLPVGLVIDTLRRRT